LTGRDDAFAYTWCSFRARGHWFSCDSLVDTSCLRLPVRLRSPDSSFLASHAVGIGLLSPARRGVDSTSFFRQCKVMESEPTSRLPAVREPASWLARLHKFRWLGTLLRLAQAESGDNEVSEGSANKEHVNGSHNGNGVGANDGSRLVAEVAVHAARARREDSDQHDSIYPELLAGAQVPYSSAAWSPDPRMRKPKGSPEREAAEGDPNRIGALDPAYLEVLDFLEELDSLSSFNTPD